jgi:hypothetical protein
LQQMRPRLEALSRSGAGFFVARVVSRALELLDGAAPRTAHAG